MPVRISAVLDHPTVLQLLQDLTPLTVRLGDEDDRDRWMRIEAPELVEFVERRGIRVRTTARMQWTVAGVAIPFTIRTITILLELGIEKTATGERLAVVPMIEDADLKNIPETIDDKIVDVANRRLGALAGTIGWTYGKTLALRLPMPRALGAIDFFEMDATGGKLEVDSDLIQLTANLPMRFSRDRALTDEARVPL